MAHDPVVAETVREADHLEPRFVLPDQEARVAAKLDAYRGATGKRPNVVFIYFDDVGWGDFGCYGGGVAVGAPTPNIDRLARRGLLLTSCYSEPSCTPSRASLLTGRLPMRHGLLRPPMYGEPGGLAGEITLAQLLSDAGYVTQAVGKWHMGENVESQPQHVGFDDFYGFLSVSDMYTEWRDPYFFPEIVYSEERTRWVQNLPFNKCFVHATRGAELETVEEVTIPVLSELDDRWATYSLEFIRRMGARRGTPDEQPWFLYHCTRGAHFDNYPHERFLGRSPAKHPYKDTIIELDDIVGRLVAELEATGQLEDTLVFISSDNGPEMETWPDAAYSPFRCAKGSTWEGGQRVPGILVWPGMIDADRVSDGIFSQMDLFPTVLRLAGAEDRIPSDRYIDAVDQTSFLLDGDGVSNRKYLYYWLTSVFSGLRVGEWKYLVAATSDDDRDALNLGGFSGVTQRYTYGRLYNLYLDPKETRSYLIRKLAYVESLTSGVVNHLATFGTYPPKHPIASMP
ncbi:arylsulfatase [Rhabdothermincola sediminis]|uniref:arylsulfatase n=1 Tax=Rhabdothermincola sediminis TaxID=2751370 RepID=UPI001AA024BB|nr:arylsulfatase [Rhabdothermincola sediminis]